jgi:hypothetical protein
MVENPATPDAGSATGDFAAATAVTPIDADGTTRRWAADVPSGWDIAGNANGGYLLAIAARAMVGQLGRPDPVSVTGHYLSPGQVGPLDVEVTTVREGRRFSTARAEITSEGKPVLSTIGTFGDLSDAGEPIRVQGSPPDLPPPSECMGMPALGEGEVPSFMNRVDLRLHPEDTGFARGEPSGEARVRGWFSLPGGEPVDTIALLCALDAFPPTIFNADLPLGWVPTLEFTAHLRGRPAPGPLAAEFTTRFVTGGFLEEDGLIWDGQGTLVGQSRQLALLPRPS